MYKITFPIPIVAHGQSQVSMPTGLARDLISQLKFESELKIVCPQIASGVPPSGYVKLDRCDFPGLSWRLLPWSGGHRQFWLKLPAIRRILIEEAKTSSVWHSGCGITLWDITAMGFQVGRHHAPGLKVFSLDSDPAGMLEQTNTWSSRWLARRLDRRYRCWAAEADATVMVGAGVVQRFGASARLAIPTNAVWLNASDLAAPHTVAAKFDSPTPLKIILPSRLLPWKGVDDAINALISVQDKLGDWQLDIIGEGGEIESLKKLAAPLGSRVRFLGMLPYGETFFDLLRRYHVAIVPTRANEEARIVYDAAASGCVLVSSRTTTLESALASVPIRYTFKPGNVASLAEAIVFAVADSSRWGAAAAAGVNAMRERTIDEMHRIRSAALAPLRVRAARAVPRV